MAECIILKGGGVDLDAVTAGAGDVLAGKVIVDKNGESLTGTMPNQGAVNQSLGINGTYTIPAGYHNGSGKVTQSVSAYGGTYWNNSLEMGLEADNLYSFFPVGYYAQYDSRGSLHRIPIARLRSALGLTAPRIKKGETIAGVTGTFEGYVPTATDLYLRGNNVAGFTASSSLGVFDAGQITITQSGSTRLLLTASFSIVGYNYLNLEGNTTNSYDTIRECRLYRQDVDGNWKLVASNDTQINPGNYTKSLNISTTQISGNFRIQLFQMAGSLYRIWLS